MQIIRDAADLDALGDPFLRALITSRLADMTQGDDYDPDVHGFFVVMQDNDALPAVEAVVETTLLRNPVTGVEYGQADFSPIFEYVGAHTDWFEIVIVPGYGDFGVVLFVPRQPDVDARLLALCAEYAVPEPAPV